MLEIDGAMGEGGGQILRSALTLAVCTGRPFRISNIRSRRSRPGLRPQHLAAVRAAAEISGARVEGAAVDSQTLLFTPGRLRPGSYRWAIGTAGSVMLLLQTVVPALMRAGQSSRLEFEGGTHVPQAPTYEFVALCYLPVLRGMGPGLRIELLRHGFYPRGGGLVRLDIDPAERLSPPQLLRRGAARGVTAEILLARLPAHIAEREAGVLADRLSLDPESIVTRQVGDSLSPGNVVTVVSRHESLTEVCAAVGRRGLRAERVAAQAAAGLERYLASHAAVGEHLADQLLVPLAIAGGGRMVTLRPSLHARTNIEVIRRFTDCPIAITEDPDGRRWEIAFGASGAR